MLLLEPARTPYDLHFRLFGISVRVHPMFWLMSAILGWRGQPTGPLFLAGLAIWIGAVFVSILIHEMGHVFMGRFFGSDGHIVLYSFGGLAIGSNALSDGRKRALVSFAGPLAQFLLVAIILAAVWQFILRPADRAELAWNWKLPANFLEALANAPYHPLLLDFIWDMIFINLFWALINLLPIFPLDGGQISREVCLGLSRDKGVRFSLGISMVLAALLAINALLGMRKDSPPLIPVVGGMLRGWWIALLFGLLAYQSLQMLQAAEAERRWRDDHWED